MGHLFPSNLLPGISFSVQDQEGSLFQFSYFSRFVPFRPIDWRSRPPRSAV